MLINEEYFKAEIVIPNLSSVGNGASRLVAGANLDLLESFINKYEKSFLNELLGNELSNEFIKALKGELSGKWGELKSRLVDEQNHESPIANYVYYWYMRNSVSTTTGVGEVETMSDNSMRVTPSLKMARAWNEMVDNVLDIACWLYDQKEFHYKPCDSDIFHKINMMNI